jgi:hypothetical protein
MFVLLDGHRVCLTVHSKGGALTFTSPALPDGYLKLTTACRSGMNPQMNHCVKSHSISDSNKKIQQME